MLLSFIDVQHPPVHLNIWACCEKNGVALDMAQMTELSPHDNVVINIKINLFSLHNSQPTPCASHLRIITFNSASSQLASIS